MSTEELSETLYRIMRLSRVPNEQFENVLYLLSLRLRNEIEYVSKRTSTRPTSRTTQNRYHLPQSEVDVPVRSTHAQFQQQQQQQQPSYTIPHDYSRKRKNIKRRKRNQNYEEDDEDDEDEEDYFPQLPPELD